MASWAGMSCLNGGAVATVMALLLVLFSALQSTQVYAQQPGGVSVGYYQSNGLCNADIEGIVLNAVQTAAQTDPTIPAGLLRLLFHDCWVQVRKPSALALLWTVLNLCWNLGNVDTARRRGQRSWAIRDLQTLSQLEIKRQLQAFPRWPLGIHVIAASAS